MAISITSEHKSDKIASLAEIQTDKHRNKPSKTHNARKDFSSADLSHDHVVQHQKGLAAMTQAIIFTSPFYQSRSRPPTNLRPASRRTAGDYLGRFSLARQGRRRAPGAEARAGPGWAFGVT